MAMQGDFLGRGFSFPVCADPVTGRIQTAEYEEDIRQAIYLILMTRKGERVMRPEFGCSIHDFAFDTMDFGILSQMEDSVRESLILWEPRIREIEVKVCPGESTGELEIRISYVVRTTNNPYNLVYPFYLNEGIEL